MEQPVYSFEVLPRRLGGWKLRLLQDGDEDGGGVFEAGDDGFADAVQLGQDWVETSGRPNVWG